MLQSPIKLETFRKISLDWFLPLAYVVGLAYIALLPELSQEYYVDENAFIVHSIQASSSVDDFRTILTLPGPPQLSSTLIEQWLADALGSPSILIRIFEGDSVYAILRSRRSNAEDSFVIVVPYYASNGNHVSGVHIVAALLKYLSNVKWLAKDIIVLFVPAHTPSVVSNWVEAYHSVYPNWNQTNNFPMDRAGVIRAALIFDLPPSSTVDGFSVVCHTSQAVLPNFDMVAIIQYMMQQHNIPLTISDHYNSSLLRSSSKFFPILETWRPMLRFMADALYAPQSAFHAPFIDYNIDALSLFASGASTKSVAREAMYLSMIQALEGTVRAFSNLIEKLHHSSFVYIITSNMKLTTFLIYYWAAVIIALPWPLCVIHRLGDDLPLSTMIPAFQAFFLLLIWSLSLQYLPALFKGGFLWNLILCVLSSLLSLFVYFFYAPRRISWAWFHSLVALMSLVVVLPYSVLNFTVTLVFILATVPLVLVRPPKSAFDSFRNISLLLLSSPVIPLMVLSIVYETSVLSLLHCFIECISTSIHHLYPLTVFLYLPNYIAAIAATFFFRSTHIKTE